MTKSLNIGLVGSGFMGQAHTAAYRRAGMLYRNLPCIPVLYAIADQNDSLAEEAWRKLGFGKAYGDWRRLIEDPDVHVVDITTPNHLHVDVALAALEAGKHGPRHRPKRALCSCPISRRTDHPKFDSMFVQLGESF